MGDCYITSCIYENFFFIFHFYWRSKRRPTQWTKTNLCSVVRFKRLKAKIFVSCCCFLILDKCEFQQQQRMYNIWTFVRHIRIAQLFFVTLLYMYRFKQHKYESFYLITDQFMNYFFLKYYYVISSIKLSLYSLIVSKSNLILMSFYSKFQSSSFTSNLKITKKKVISTTMGFFLNITPKSFCVR